MFHSQLSVFDELMFNIDSEESCDLMGSILVDNNSTSIPAGSCSPTSSVGSDETGFYSDGIADTELFPELETLDMSCMLSPESDFEHNTEDLHSLLTESGIAVEEPVSDIKVPLRSRALPKVPEGYAITTRSRSNDNSARVIRVVPDTTRRGKPSNQDTIKQLEDEANRNQTRRNAIQAKINREKKKAYIESLEGEVSTLQLQNKELVAKTTELKQDKESLVDEVKYLKNIIANQSTLSNLLQNIPNVTGVKLHSSFGLKRAAELDHDYRKPAKRAATPTSRNAGICLHVNNSNVSLELCSQCSNMANSNSN